MKIPLLIHQEAVHDLDLDNTSSIHAPKSQNAILKERIYPYSNSFHALEGVIKKALLSKVI
jgi:hypothetical protein